MEGFCFHVKDLPARSPTRLQLCFYLFLGKCVKLREGLKWNFHLAWKPFSVKDPCRWGSCAVWHETCIYNQYDNLLTYNNTSPPPRSFDCKWGHFPLLQIINYTFFQKDNVRLNITPTMLTVLFQEVCECVCANTHVYVSVLTLARHWLIVLKMKLLH